MNEWTDDSRGLQESNFSRKAATGRHIMSYRQLRVKDLPKVPMWRLEVSRVEPKAPNNTPKTNYASKFPSIRYDQSACFTLTSKLFPCLARDGLESVVELIT